MTHLAAVQPLTDFPFDAPGRDLESLKHAIANKLMFTVGKDPKVARAEDWLNYIVDNRLRFPQYQATWDSWLSDRQQELAEVKK